MSTITVRQVPEEVKRALRLRAAQRGRSMEAEVRAILAEAALEPDTPISGAEFVRRIRAAVAEVGGAEPELPPREPLRDPPDFSEW